VDERGVIYQYILDITPSEVIAMLGGTCPRCGRKLEFRVEEWSGEREDKEGGRSLKNKNTLFFTAYLDYN